MKVKGVNFFEQHVEKIVVGVLGAGALGVLAWQFLGSPNSVTVNGQPVPPDRAYEPLKQTAENLRSRVESATPNLPDPPKTDVLAKFEKGLTGGIAPRPDLAVAFGPKVNVGQVQGGPKGDAVYVDIRPLAPRAPVARASEGCTIDPSEKLAYPELAQYLPKEQPYDVFSVGIEVTYDGKAFRESLANDPDGINGPIEPIPGGWINTVEVLGVEVEREQVDSPTGSKPAITMVKPMPGRANLLADLSTRVKSPGDMPRVLEAARSYEEEILRPKFYAQIAGEPWTPPSLAGASGSLAEKIDAVQKQVNAAQAELERMNRTLAAQRGRENAPGPRRGGEEEGPGGKGAGGGGGGGGHQTGRDTSREQGKKLPIEIKIEAQEAKITALTAQLAKLKDERDGVKPVATMATLAFMNDPAARIWAHDLTGEPGATYRYRVRVVVSNPLFGKDASLKEEQKPRAEQPVIRGDWSEWSDDVSIDRRTYYFISAASERDNLGPARATAELLQFYYGYYRRATLASMTPGDVFVGETGKLPAELRLYDEAKLAAGVVRTGQPIAEVPAQDDGQDAGGHGGKGRGRDEVEQPAAAKPEQPKGPAPADEFSKPVPERLTVAINAVLMDVAAAPVPSGPGKAAPTRAFVRDVNGKIVLHSPDALQENQDTEEGKVFRRVMRSAKLGESQGKPVVKESDEARPDVRRPPPDSPAVRPPKDDGGGGGG